MLVRENANHYEFTFENGTTYYGTIEDKNNLVKHFTKEEKIETGKVVSKKKVTRGEVERFRTKAMLSICL